MIDYVRLFWRDKVRFEDFVCKEENFKELDTLFELHTRQIKYPYRTSFNNMDVRVTSKYGYVHNSIHKAYNDKCGVEAHNHNDFSYSSICEMVEHISSKVIDVKSASLNQLEFGLNIEIPIPATQILRNNLFMHKYKGVNHNRLFNGGGNLKQFDYHNYVVKIYDKAMQYNLDKNILRFEVRFQKRKELQRLGIYKLEDLKDKNNIRKLFIILLRRFDELTIVDTYDEVIIPDEDLAKLIRYGNPHYWETTLKNFSNTTKMRRKREYEELLCRHGLLTIKSMIREQIISKYLQLINF